MWNRMLSLLPVAAMVVAAAWVTLAAGQEGAGPRPPGPGTEVWTVQHGGLSRTLLVHKPSGPKRGGRASLIIALHGGGGTGRGMEMITGLSALADQEGFVVVYPDGVGRSWNDGRGLQSFAAMRRGLDDVGFISAVIDDMISKANVDPGRVYVTGISNGGHMSHRLGAELSDKIAAIAPVAANMPTSVAQGPTPAYPVSVIQFFGTEDRHNYWNGGGAAGGETLSVPAAMALWARWNGCAQRPKVETLPTLVNDGTGIRREDYGSCRGGTDVVLYAVEGGGHNAPGWHQYLPVEVIGHTSQNLDANRTMWAFFQRHGRAMR